MSPRTRELLQGYVIQLAIPNKSHEPRADPCEIGLNPPKNNHLVFGDSSPALCLQSNSPLNSAYSVLKLDSNIKTIFIIGAIPIVQRHFHNRNQGETCAMLVQGPNQRHGTRAYPYVIGPHPPKITCPILKTLRFYDISVESVKIDNQDVCRVYVKSWALSRKILFYSTTTSSTTLQYSKQDATNDDIVKACTTAAVHEKILSFTNSYKTMLGEKRVKLSGGEIQRIAIAHAILKDPKIILLDEATSAVDSETEYVIQSALRELTAGRTTLIIAHRLSTVMEATYQIFWREKSVAHLKFFG